MNQIQVLDSTGHITLEWESGDAESEANARAEVARLRDAGYSFFVDDNPADEIAAGRGKLYVRRVDDPVTAMTPEPPQPLSAEHDARVEVAKAADEQHAKRQGRRAVGIRPQAGG